jgi:putative ubiquitin-RnfH superfamily antitoxin RatB of RatAB toxin-antitoxin module
MSDTVKGAIPLPAIVQRRQLPASVGNGLFFVEEGGVAQIIKDSLKIMGTIRVEVWLYGPVARYAGEQSQGSYAELHLDLPAGTTVQNLAERLGIPPEEKGITFVNGKLAALPGMEADSAVVLRDGDRVGISHRKSMWPHQYRFGAATTSQLEEEFRQRKDHGIRHEYK